MMDGQKTMLTEQLSSCQEQVRTLQSELDIYQKLLKDARKSSSAGGHMEVGVQASTSGGGGRGESLDHILEEVAGLRDQLDTSIQNNNSLADQLRTRLDHTFAGASFTDKSPRTKEKGSGTGHTHLRSTQTQHSVRTNVSSSGAQTRPRGEP